MKLLRHGPKGRERPAVVLFLFFLFVVVVLVLVFVVLEVGVRLFFFLFGLALGRDHRRDLLVELELDADVAELRVHQLEQLVDVVARPLVEHVGEELEEIARVQATLDLLDLLLGEGLEDVLAQSLAVALLDRVLGRELDLSNGALVEVDLHWLSGGAPANKRTARALSTLPARA